MDEKIIRLCEENNVPSLVQALSTLKNQKVCTVCNSGDFVAVPAVLSYKSDQVSLLTKLETTQSADKHTVTVRYV